MAKKIADLSCGVSPAVRDHTVLPASQQVNIFYLNTSQAGWYSIQLHWRHRGL